MTAQTCSECGRTRDHTESDVGWLNLIQWREDDDELPVEADFCSLACLATWATAQIQLA